MAESEETYVDPKGRKLSVVVNNAGKTSIELRGGMKGECWKEMKDFLEKNGRGGVRKKKPHFLYWDVPNNQDPKIFAKNNIARLLKVFETKCEINLEVDYLIDSLRNDENVDEALKKDIEGKLEGFKEMLVNIESDEELTNLMKSVLQVSATEGFPYSIHNRILINIQRPNHGVVNSEGVWALHYERRVKPSSKPIYIATPMKEGASDIVKKSPTEKKTIIQGYLEKAGVSNRKELTPRDKGLLKKDLFDDIIGATRFYYSPAYDEADTYQIEGTEDLFQKNSDGNTAEKFEENMISDKVKPVYNAVLELTHDIGMNIELVDTLEDGAVSVGDKIKILKSAGDDVGLTTKILGEMYVGFLNQTYKKTKKDAGVMTSQSVKEQAVLGAWMTMYVLGFDVKRASINHALLWGGQKEKMLTVFDIVSFTVNKVTSKLLTLMGRTRLTEDGSSVEDVDPEMIADFLGIEQEFAEIQRQLNMRESLRSGLGN